MAGVASAAVLLQLHVSQALPWEKQLAQICANLKSVLLHLPDWKVKQMPRYPMCFRML